MDESIIENKEISDLELLKILRKGMISNLVRSRIKRKERELAMVVKSPLARIKSTELIQVIKM
jgi:hypothetical protein